jgi:hypothetical protein
MARVLGLSALFGTLSFLAWAGGQPASDSCSNTCMQELTACMKGCGMDPAKPPKDATSTNMACIKKCSTTQQACQRKCK